MDIVCLFALRSVFTLSRKPMFEIAFAIGIFSYSVYFLGLAGFLYAPILAGFTILFWLGFIFWRRKQIVLLLKQFQLRNNNPLILLGSLYIILQACINVVGLLGPEIGFDATWYHLTLPKLYLLYHAIVHFPGSILYYSDMPRLTEMLFTAGLSLGSDFWARGVEFIFGILTSIIVYRLGKKFVSPVWAIAASVIFYSNLVVGWESISGYIDLSRTFFSSLSLLAFFLWTEKKDQKLFIYFSLLVGLTIATKLLALPDLLIYCAALFLFDMQNTSLTFRLKRIGSFLAIALIPLVPWFAFAFVHTGNPIFPMLTSYDVGNTYWQFINPLFLFPLIWATFASASDPINPIFLACTPFFVLFAKKLWQGQKLLVIITVGTLLSWYITPQTGGGRYVLPALIPLSLVCVYIISHLSKNWQKLFLVFIFLVAALSLFYRGFANAKFLPVIFHKQPLRTFMASHLQYTLGDFYDTDGYFAQHIKPTDTVLLYGFHNLYYVNFPFIDSSWVKPGDSFDYIAIQGKGMPTRFAYWNLVYFNPITQVRLYSLKGQTWYY